MKKRKRGFDIESKTRDRALEPIDEIKELDLHFLNYLPGEIEKSLGKFLDKCYTGESPGSKKN